MRRAPPRNARPAASMTPSRTARQRSRRRSLRRQVSRSRLPDSGSPRDHLPRTQSPLPCEDRAPGNSPFAQCPKRTPRFAAVYGASRTRTGVLLGAIHSLFRTRTLCFAGLLGRAPVTPQYLPQHSWACFPGGQLIAEPGGEVQALGDARGLWLPTRGRPLHIEAASVQALHVPVRRSGKPSEAVFRARVYKKRKHVGPHPERDPHAEKA